MKSLAKPRYTQEQYDQASAVYMRWCYVQALREGRPVPSKPARLPLLRPTYGREVAGVAKAVSMHLGVSVHLVRFIFIITSFFFGSGLIAYIFLWITIPTGDPVQQAYAIAGSQPVGNAPLSRGNAPYGESVAHGFMGNGAGTQNVGTQSAKPARWQTKRHRKTDGNRPKAWNRCSDRRRNPHCWPWRDSPRWVCAR